jgi:hypothetical protein
MMKEICFGLLVVFFCEPQTQAVPKGDFCKLVEPEIAKFKALSDLELSALARPRKEAILSLRRKYTALCLEN